ncbi:hypothetical protein [uncultured Roseibium sp.]|uniref:hypothetical protein n=1 Tax=uncultured Roseibium sp. TaxID=1936171 RepID=UPI00263329DF|nr:hypothetical protein [uncultured Roseibium sp.]
MSLEDGARTLRMGKETVRRAQHELERKGFIVKIKEGQFYGRLAAEWRLTDCSFEGHPATRDWQIKKPEKAGQKTKRGSETGPSKWLMDPI